MQYYFIGDLHFGDKGILRYERTEFTSTDEHDRFIIDSINSVVRLTDTLYVLGDVGNPDKVRLLNGKKILIMGNHDKRAKVEYETYFHKVYDTPIYFNKRVLLSHFPEPVTSEVLNLHGHLHGSYLDSANHKNLSAALIDYKPITSDKISNFVAQLPKNNEKFLHEWYADKYIFLNHDRSDVVVSENGKIKLTESLDLREKLFSNK